MLFEVVRFQQYSMPVFLKTLTSMNNVTDTCNQGRVSKNVLEGQRRKKDHGVDRGRDTDNGDAGGDETTGAPDPEGHDRVVDPALNENEHEQQHDADHQRGERRGFGPTIGRSLTEVVDNGDNTEAEGNDTKVIDTTVLILGFTHLRRDHDQTPDRHSKTDNRSEVEDPSPALSFFREREND